jgi:MGT family glycosyltransferase
MNFLIVTIEGGGNIPPILNLTKQLVHSGHQVTILSEPWFKKLAESNGANFVAFKEYFTKTDRKKDILEDWKSQKNGFENVIFGPAKIVVTETIAAIQANSIDVLIVDVILPGGLIAGEAMKIPRVCLFHMPEYLPAINRPPGGLGLVPGKGILGKLRDQVFGTIFNQVFNQYLPKINAMRVSLNLPKQKNVADLFHSTDLRIIQTSPAFDFPILPTPANVVYTGPILDDPDWVKPWQNQWPKADKRPLVVVSLSSTFQNQKKALTQCINALGSMEVRGLVTLGLAMEGEQFELPENVKVIANGSHAAIFPHADAVITHAGHGTVMRALANGLPMVCMPFGRDQGDNAAKVEYHGVGIQISQKANASKIRKSMQQILENKDYKVNARKLGEIIKTDAKNGNLVELLERLKHKELLKTSRYQHP